MGQSQNQNQSQSQRQEYLADSLKSTFGENFPIRLALVDKIEREKAAKPLVEQQPTQSPIDMNSPEASEYLSDFLNQRKPKTYGQFSDEQRKYQDYGSPQDSVKI